MELREAVKARLAMLPDVTMTVKDKVVSTGQKFSVFNINKRGTVYQFVSTYPVTDEKQIAEFIRKVEKEL